MTQFGQSIPKPLDEPGKLRKIVAQVFAGQSGWQVGVQDEPAVSVIAGADAQDDCAVLRIDQPVDLVVGSDYVRGSKFFLYEYGLLDDFDIGWYLAAANFSDIAAMGAEPVALLSVVRYPRNMPDESFGRVLRGIADSCASVNAINIGGDIGTAERLFLSASALGVVAQGQALLRSGARPGDLVCVTGATGTAGAALAYFRSLDSGQISRRLGANEEEALLRPWRRARAKVAEGRVLATSALATACIDTSDGLKGALQGLAEQSHVGIEVDMTKIVVESLVEKAAQSLQRSAYDFVFGDSVDFELAFTVRSQDVEALADAFERAGLSFYPIGTVTAGADVLACMPDGSLEALHGEPWSHK
ncbi:thiamine-phosphate kinase [Blastococcus sp. SYSU DS0539]